MSGSHVRDWHLLLDERADQLYAMTNPLVERIRNRPHCAHASATTTATSASLVENWIDETQRRTWLLFEATRRSGDRAR